MSTIKVQGSSVVVYRASDMPTVLETGGSCTVIVVPDDLTPSEAVAFVQACQGLQAGGPRQDRYTPPSPSFLPGKEPLPGIL